MDDRKRTEEHTVDEQQVEDLEVEEKDADDVKGGAEIKSQQPVSAHRLNDRLDRLLDRID